MREMSAGLLAAAGRARREPDVLARISDEPCERPRFSWTECYRGAEPDGANAAAVALDGSILRLRASGGAYYYCRVTDIADPAQWENWAMLINGASPARLDITVDRASGRAWRGTLSGVGDSFYTSYSDNNGQTWTGWRLVYRAAAGSLIVGASIWADSGSGYCALAVNPQGGAVDNFLLIARWVGPSWSVVAQTNPIFEPIDGISLSLNGVDELSIFGASGDGVSGSRLWAQDFDQVAGVWTAKMDLLTSGAGSGVSFAEPRYFRLMGAGGASGSRASILYVERDSMTGESKVMICFTPIRYFLTEEVAWRFPAPSGVRLLLSDTDWLIVGANQAYRSKRFTGEAGERLDLTLDRIVSFESIIKLDGEGRLRLVIDNSDGRFDGAGVSGEAKCVRPGSEIGLFLGLKTVNGAEGVWQAPFWITRVGFERTAGALGAARLVIDARDTAGELAALISRRQYQWNDVTLGVVAQNCWWRVCGWSSALPHGNLDLPAPHFAVSTGDSWGKALERICRQTGTLARWRNIAEAGVGWGSAYPEVIDLGVEKETPDADLRSLVISSKLWQSEPESERVAVFGEGVWAEHRDWDLVWSSWRDTGKTRLDLKLDSQAEVENRAAWEWRREGIRRAGGLLRMKLLPGLEVGDIVSLGAGETGDEKWMVVGLRSEFERGKGFASGGVYEQEVELGATVSVSPGD